MSETPGRAKLGVEFTAEIYRRAAMEHIGALSALYDADDYVLAIYVAGLSVECMLRAYRILVDASFSARHDLNELAKEAKFAELIPAQFAAKYVSDLGIITTRWTNSHRYRSEDALRRFLKRAHMDRGVKGDFLKENARKMVNSATDVVTLGDRLWKKSSSR